MMYTVIWFDDYGAYDVDSKFDNLDDAIARARYLDDNFACDSYADGCIIEDNNGIRYGY